MNIQQITITGYQFTLTESEIRAAIADPHSVTSLFKAALNGAFENGGGNGVVNHSKLDAQGRRKHSYGRNYPKDKRGATGTRIAKQSRINGSTRMPCEICGRQIARKYMPLHMSKKHAKTIAGAAD